MMKRREFLATGMTAAGALAAWGCARATTGGRASESNAATSAAAARPAYAVDHVKLVDAHGHIETAAGVALMRRERLSYALIMSRRPATFELARANKDLMGICVWLDPLEKDCLAPARAALREYPDVVKGLKFHPAGKYRVTPELFMPLFAFANDHGLMIQCHTMAPGDGNDWCSAGLFRPLLERFPATKLVLVHGTPAEEAFALMQAFEHVYGDVSYTAWGRPYAQKALRLARRDRILFGIDSPVGFPKNAAGELQPHFRDAAREVAEFYDNDPAWLDGIFWRNAEGLLGLAVPDRFGG